MSQFHRWVSHALVAAPIEENASWPSDSWPAQPVSTPNDISVIANRKINAIRTTTVVPNTDGNATERERDHGDPDDAPDADERQAPIHVRDRADVACVLPRRRVDLGAHPASATEQQPGDDHHTGDGAHLRFGLDRAGVPHHRFLEDAEGKRCRDDRRQVDQAAERQRGERAQQEQQAERAADGQAVDPAAKEQREEPEDRRDRPDDALQPLDRDAEHCGTTRHLGGGPDRDADAGRSQQDADGEHGQGSDDEGDDVVCVEHA